MWLLPGQNAMRISALMKEPKVLLVIDKDGARIWLTAFTPIK